MTRADAVPRPGVVRSLLVHPGVLLVASLAGAGLAERAVPIRAATRMETRPIQALVTALLVGAILVFAWCFRTFRRHATPLAPGSTPAVLVTDGPFARSRNPMYVALLLVSLALAIVASSLWFFGATIGLTAILDRIVIAREERILAERFGTDFAAYRTRVRRWI